jgi:hypothetical protein
MRPCVSPLILAACILQSCSGLHPVSVSGDGAVLCRGPLVHSHANRGARHGYDFETYRLQLVIPSGGEPHHELYAQIAYSGRSRTYNVARFDSQIVRQVRRLGEEATTCPESRVGPACDHQVNLSVPLLGWPTSPGISSALTVEVSAGKMHENTFHFTSAYVDRYLNSSCVKTEQGPRFR